MAMTKAERAEMEALRVRCALSWPPEPPKPVDVRITAEESGAAWMRLWYLNKSTGRIALGVTNGSSLHARENYTDARLEARYRGNSHVSLSQGAGGPWYATEADALRALHYAVALECAEKLAALSARVASLQGVGE